MADSFRWVEARAKCSALHVFSELLLGVEEDVKAINETDAVKTKARPSLAVMPNTDGNYFVVFHSGNAADKVEFRCHQDCIKVSRGDREFIVTLTLDNQGQCRLRIDGGENLEQWQVRRTMLEDLFFHA